MAVDDEGAGPYEAWGDDQTSCDPQVAGACDAGARLSGQVGVAWGHPWGGREGEGEGHRGVGGEGAGPQQDLVLWGRKRDPCKYHSILATQANIIKYGRQ